MERQKTGEIIRVSSVKSQKLGQKKKKSCTTHCSLVIKNKGGGKEREREEEIGEEQENGEGKRGGGGKEKGKNK